MLEKGDPCGGLTEPKFAATHLNGASDRPIGSTYNNQNSREAKFVTCTSSDYCIGVLHFPEIASLVNHNSTELPHALSILHSVKNE